MANILMGRLAFFAQATVLSNFFEHGFGASGIGQYLHGHLKKEIINHGEAVVTADTPDKDHSSFVGSKEADRITNLPGLNFDPGFDQYSGYLTVDEDHQRKIFYWYVESQGNPETDPVMFWTNGGPGCSGFLGLGTEHGPFFISRDGILKENPYSWNLVANILYVEQPAGVGFSYSEHSKDYHTGDSQSAADNYVAIRQFLERFPDRRANDFYISSESYGGHYMPQLTKEILKRNTDGFINFKGMMVGNPYVDPFTNAQTQFQAWYQHGLLPWPVYKKYKEHCHDPETYLNGRCQNYIGEMFDELGKGINPYGLNYPVCVEDRRDTYASKQTQVQADGSTSETGTSRRLTISSQIQQFLNQSANSVEDSTGHNPPFLPTEYHYRPCADEHLSFYLNRLDVVTAIHANPDTLPWHGCSHKVHYDMTDHSVPQIKNYKEILELMNNDVDLRMLIFSGDDDSICSLAGTQAWIWDMGFHARSIHNWQPWQVGNQTAGFVTRFDMKNEGSSFTFATVHGAGHEVPAYRPKEALELLVNYLDGKW